MPKRDITWWFWLATDIALANYLFVDREFFKVAIALSLIQIPVFASLHGWKSFPAQVRIAYLCLLFAGLWQPLAIVHWMQLVGTTAMVLFGYCFLARCLSLLPWNRNSALTLRLVANTFFMFPVQGSILSAQDGKTSQR